MSAQKHQRDILKMARSVCPAATIEKTRGDHLRVVITGPNGQRRIHVGATPSDHRALKNSKRDITAAAREVGCIPERNKPADIQLN